MPSALLPISSSERAACPDKLHAQHMHHMQTAYGVWIAAPSP